MKASILRNDNHMIQKIAGSVLSAALAKFVVTEFFKVFDKFLAEKFPEKAAKDNLEVKCLTNEDYVSEIYAYYQVDYFILITSAAVFAFLRDKLSNLNQIIGPIVFYYVTRNAVIEFLGGSGATSQELIFDIIFDIITISVIRTILNLFKKKEKMPKNYFDIIPLNKNEKFILDTFKNSFIFEVLLVLNFGLKARFYNAGIILEFFNNSRLTIN